MPLVVAETYQPTDEPSEGIDTSPNTSRPWILWTHDQHVADYVCIMVESGMSLPTTCYRGIVTFLSFFTSHTILYLAYGPLVYCHPFIHHCLSFHSGPSENQASQPYP